MDVVHLGDTTGNPTVLILDYHVINTNSKESLPPNASKCGIVFWFSKWYRQCCQVVMTVSCRHDLTTLFVPLGNLAGCGPEDLIRVTVFFLL